MTPAPAVLMLWLAAASGLDIKARVVTGPEADSNARREISGQVPQPDLLWRSQAGVTAAHRQGRHRVVLDGQWGAKVFTTQHTEDLWVLEAHGRLESGWLPFLVTFVDVGGRDRRQRSGFRTYNTLNADVGASLGPFGPLTVTLAAGPRSFVSWPAPVLAACSTGLCARPLAEASQDGDVRLAKDSVLRFSNAGPGGYGQLLWRLNTAESMSAAIGADGRVFPLGLRAQSVTNGTRVFDSRGRPNGAAEVLDQVRLPARRADASSWGEVAVESVRALYLRASWRLVGNLSASQGEQFFRARLGLTAGALLPGGVRALAEVQLQATRWPQGLGLGERLALQEGDESQTNAAILLSVPLAGGLWAEARTAAYTAEFSAARTPFLRLVGFAGLGWRW